MAERPHSIDLDAKFGFLHLVDVDKLRRESPEGWTNQTPCRANDCVVRLGVVEGEFHWRKHDREDEFFYVVDGRLFIDLEEGRTVALAPN